MVSQKDKNRLYAILALIFLVFTAWLLLSPYGAWRSHQLSRELAIRQAENEKLREDNQALQKEINRLQNDPAYIEEVARKELGFIKKNEIIFDFSRQERKKK